MFRYWTLDLLLELLIFQLVHSTRTGNFEQYIESLTNITPRMFALDLICYAGWLSVHLRNLCQLVRKHPSVHQAFGCGAFTVRKTKRLFSAMALDHAQEQCNALVKGDGVAVGLTNNPGALGRWITAGQEIARELSDFDSFVLIPKALSSDHHEHSPEVQKTFKKDVQALVAQCEESGNPFEDDTGQLYSLDIKDIANSHQSPQ